MSTGNKRDYYEVLGVNKTASEGDIKSSFRKLSRKYHPDMQSGKSDSEKKQAEEKFKELAEAYEVLSDKDKRANYDQFGFNGPNMFGGGGGMDMADFMRRHAEAMFGGMGGGFDPFGAGFNFGHQYGNSQPHQHDFNSPENGRDVQTKIDITFMESMMGCEKEFAIDSTCECNECHGTGVENGTTPKQCNTCGGTGQVVHTERHGFMISQQVMQCPECGGMGVKMSHCHKCHGNKRTTTKKKISVSIPQGISSGQRVKLQGQGQCGVKGGSNGNMYISINVIGNSVFERNGNDLYVKQWIDPITASLGGNIDIKTPYKTINLKIPSGITSGKKLRVHSEGVKTSSGSGDLYVEVSIEPFNKLTKQQEEKLKELKDLLTEKNFPKKIETDNAIANALK